MSTSERSAHTILVVDDAQAQRYAIARGLRAQGFATLEAETGGQALELAGRASALVLDVNLPDIQGTDVCRSLRAGHATTDLPVVHVSAVYITAYHRALADRAGADAYMVTPVDAKALAATLDRLIAQRPAR
jgi:DNA-binding response OmpR family regulator